MSSAPISFRVLGSPRRNPVCPELTPGSIIGTDSPVARTITIRRLVLASTLVVALGVFAAWRTTAARPASQVQVSNDQRATSTTATSIVMIDGKPVPVPPLPPGVTLGNDVTNLHVPVTALDPAAQAAVNDMLRALAGNTTTTRP